MYQYPAFVVPNDVSDDDNSDCECECDDDYCQRPPQRCSSKMSCCESKNLDNIMSIIKKRPNIQIPPLPPPPPRPPKINFRPVLMIKNTENNNSTIKYHHHHNQKKCCNVCKLPEIPCEQPDIDCELPQKPCYHPRPVVECDPCEALPLDDVVPCRPPCPPQRSCNYCPSYEKSKYC